MPTYTARHIKNPRKNMTMFMTISEMEEWSKTHPEYEIACGAPLIHSGSGLGLKTSHTDQNFKDAIKDIKKKNPNNTIGNFIKD